jgi:hypothetical protein
VLYLVVNQEILQFAIKYLTVKYLGFQPFITFQPFHTNLRVKKMVRKLRFYGQTAQRLIYKQPALSFSASLISFSSKFNLVEILNNTPTKRMIFGVLKGDLIDIILAIHYLLLHTLSDSHFIK